MSRFTDFGLNLSVEEIDRKVAMGLPIASIAQGYTLRADVPDIGDWRFVWTTTRGEGNRGKLIALPKSKRSANIARKGRISKVVGLTGDLEFSERYVRFARGVKYAHEERVIEIVNKYHLQLAGLSPASWREAEASLGEIVLEVKESGLSYWRLLAAIEISTILVKSYI